MNTTHATLKASAEFVRVTPTVATNWLGLNYAGQRKLKLSTVARYAREMKHGKWIGDNGQSIVFSSDGWLVDGQHRLRAVIQSGITVEMLVVHSSRTADEIMATIDAGDRRCASQLYSGPNATAVCYIAKFELCLVYGTQGLASCLNGRLGQSKYENGKKAIDVPTSREVLEYLEENEEHLQDVFVQANRIYGGNSNGVSRTTCNAFVDVVRFCKMDGCLTDFCEDFVSVSPNSLTIGYLKRYLFNARARHGRKLEKKAELDAMLRAYDAFTADRICKSFGGSYTSLAKWSTFINARREEL